MNQELPCLQAGFRKGRETRDSISNIHWIIEKAREFQKNIYFCFIDSAKVFDCLDHKKLCKILQEMGIPEYIQVLQEYLQNCMQVKNQQSELDMGQWTGSKLEKKYVKAVYLSLYLFNLYAEYIMWNAGLDEAQARTKIAGRNINNLRYGDDTTLMAESKKELKSLLIKVIEESEKAGLKLNIQKSKIMASGPITSWQIDGETMQTVTDFTFLGSKSLQIVTAAMK